MKYVLTSEQFEGVAKETEGTNEDIESCEEENNLQHVVEDDPLHPPRIAQL